MNEERARPGARSSVDGEDAKAEASAAQIAELSRQLQATRVRLDQLKRRVFEIERGQIASAFKPKLFAFEHYPPRPLRSPRSYYQQPLPPAPSTIAMVTPSLNQARFIAQTVGSVLDQRYPNLAYHIQDGLSRDGSLEIIASIGPGFSWASERDSGQAQAINLGFERSRGEIMGYLNSDDMLLPGTLAYVASFFDAHPNVDVIYGHRVCIDENGDEIGRWVLPRHDEAVLKYVDYIPQETLFWRRKVWDALKGMDESFQFALDWDFVLRAQQSGFRFFRVPRFLGCFRVHDEQKTGLLGAVASRESTQIRRRYLDRDVSAREIERAVRWYMVRHLLYHRLYKFPLVRY